MPPEISSAASKPTRRTVAAGAPCWTQRRHPARPMSRRSAPWRVHLVQSSTDVPLHFRSTHPSSSAGKRDFAIYKGQSRAHLPRCHGRVTRSLSSVLPLIKSRSGRGGHLQRQTDLRDPDVRFEVAKKIVSARRRLTANPGERYRGLPARMPIVAINQGCPGLHLLQRLENELKVNTPCGRQLQDEASACPPPRGHVKWPTFSDHGYRRGTHLRDHEPDAPGDVKALRPPTS